MATTTPNFGWAVPTSTDLVKDGAVAIETLGDSIDASLVDLKGGTTGQVLAKASGTDMDFSWVAQDDSNAIQNALLTTTGDTIYASGASTPARLGIGSTGQVLTVASGIPSWATPASGSTLVGVQATRTNVSTSLTGGTAAALLFPTENFDTDGFHSTATNTSRITIPTGKGGKYLVTLFANTVSVNPSYIILYLYLNGSQYTASGLREGTVFRNDGQIPISASTVVTLAAADYLEFYFQQSETATANMYFQFTAIYLGA